MKKFMCIALCLLMLIGFAACGGTGGTGGTGSSESDLIIIGFAQVGSESDWRAANSNSFRDTFTVDAGYDLKFVDCQNNTEIQIKTVRKFITQEVDYIVLQANTERGWDQILTEAKDAGIPVILSDRQINSSQDLYVAWVGGNFEQESVDAMNWLNGYLAELGRDNEQINIVHMQGTMGSSAQIGRTKGINDGITANPNFNLVGQRSGDFTEAKGQEVMKAFLQGDEKIDVLIAENDNMVFGAVLAMEAAGIKPGEDIIIVSFDAVKKAMEMIIGGKINCSVECNPLHGPRVAEIIQMLEKGETPQKIMYVVEGVYDKKNAEEELPNRKY